MRRRLLFVTALAISLVAGAATTATRPAEAAFSGLNGKIAFTRQMPVLSSARVPEAVGNQGQPAIAFDGTNNLVAWTDDRSGARDIYGARVTPSGNVLDEAGIAISIATGEQKSPAVSFDGTNYLVVWFDDRLGTQSSYQIYGARVTPQGVVLDPNGFLIFSPLAPYGPIITPAVAFDGTNYLVVWRDDRSEPSDVYGARVSPAGVVLDANAIRIAGNAPSAAGPALAFDGANFLVAGGPRRGLDIYGARVARPASCSTRAGCRFRPRPLPGSRQSPSTAWIASSPGWAFARAAATFTARA